MLRLQDRIRELVTVRVGSDDRCATKLEAKGQDGQMSNICKA